MASTAYLLNGGAQAIPRSPNELAETVKRRLEWHFQGFSHPFGLSGLVAKWFRSPQTARVTWQGQ